MLDYTVGFDPADPVTRESNGHIPRTYNAVVGDAGLIVPAKNVDALVEGIERLLLDPQLRAELGARGKQRIEQHFCWHVCARQMTDYYREVLANENG